MPAVHEKPKKVFKTPMAKFVAEEIKARELSSRSIAEQQRVVRNNLQSIEALLKGAEDQVKAIANRSRKAIDKKALENLVKEKKHFRKTRLMLANLRKRIRVFRRWLLSRFRISPLTGIAPVKRENPPWKSRRERTWKQERHASNIYSTRELDEELAKAQERVEKMSKLFKAFQENPEETIEKLGKEDFEKVLAGIK